MIRAALLVVLGACAAVLTAAPRWYSPPTLRVGAVNEAYAWDEGDLPDFTVEVVREGGAQPLAMARSFSVNRPLPGLTAASSPKKWSAAWIALDALEGPGPVTVRFLARDKAVLASFPAEIQAKSFPVEDISLDATMSELRKKPNARKDKEAAEIWKVYERFDPSFPWSGRFSPPIATAVPLSAHFGDTRHYRYIDGTSSQDYHRGTDFAVPVGTPVLATAPGRVVLVADRMLTGTTVVIEHAPGVFSVYFHLSKALTKVGRSVATGETVALSGATGFVTGPHLHWEIRIGGVPVDPLALVTTGLLDNDAVAEVVSSIERPSH